MANSIEHDRLVNLSGKAEAFRYIGEQARGRVGEALHHLTYAVSTIENREGVHVPLNQPWQRPVPERQRPPVVQGVIHQEQQAADEARARENVINAMPVSASEIAVGDNTEGASSTVEPDQTNEWVQRGIDAAEAYANSKQGAQV